MAFPIQIDTTQLAYGHFRIPTVTGEQAVDGKTVPTLQLEPRSYPLSLDAAGQSVVFSVTPQGAIDYDQKYDRCLAGKGTAKLTVVGFDVTLDARPLNNSGVFFVGLPQESRERITHKTLRLAPGTYRLQQRGGTVAAFQFTLELDGTFRYDPSHDTSNGGFLAGTGTATLQLLGYAIQIDATQLSYPRFLLTGITPVALDAKTVQTLQLLPDVYNLLQGDFAFNVTPQGLVDFDPGLDNFLSGRASNTLTLSGFSVTLDGQRFPRGILLIAIAAFIQRQTVRLLPGTYFVQQTGGVVANFTFTLARDGTFAYDPTFETSSGGFLTGRGTSTLEFVGYPILLDARDYQGVSLLVHGVTLANSTPEPHPLVLLPHAEISLILRTDPPTEARFALEKNGTITLKETYPFLELQQQGGQTVVKVKKPAQLFTVSGHVRHPDLRPFVNGTVRALDITAGQGQTLAEVTTDAEGHYAMSYSSEQLRPMQKINADLQIVALDGAGQELARSGVLLKAPPEATIDLTIGAPAEPGAFIVRGVIRQATGAPMAGVTVRAFDRDLPSLQPNEELLGETTTDAGGLYQITYTPDQLLHAETNSADLEVRVLNPEGAVLATSPIYFNAPPEATIDVVVVLPEQQLSELEQLLAELEPALSGVKPAALTGEDMAFLIGDTGIEQERLDLLRSADQRAQETGLPTAVFYGFGRQNLSLDLAELLDLDAATLRQALEATIAANIIPAAVRDTLDATIARLVELRARQLIPAPQQVTLRLVNQATSIPLAGYTVRPHDLDAGPNPVDLAPSVTNPQGLVTVNYTAMRPRAESEGAAEEAPRRLRLVVLTPEDQEIHQAEVAASPDQAQPIEVQVPLPPVPEFPTHVFSELSKTLQRDLPPGLLEALAAQGIRTLEDIRRAGGMGQVQGRPVPLTDPSVHWLDSHASLTLVSPDVQVNEGLIERGYPTMADIAETAREDFVNATRELLGEAEATRMHAVAQAQISYLDNLLTTARVEQANGYQAPTEALALRASALRETTAPTMLGCKDCLSAVSPLAYLADLLNYAVNHLTYQKKRIDLTWLTTTFHQPFAELPTACNTVTSQVRRVRLSVEVLRQYLQSFTPNEDQVKALLAAEREYLLAAYTTLLGQVGTSFDELRAVRTAPNGTGVALQHRQALLERLGVAPDRLEAMLLSGVVVTTFHSVTPAPIASLERDLKALFASLQVAKDINLGGVPQPEIVIGQLTEEALEILFGLQSTHTRHLSGERPASKLPQWRQEYLRTLWFAQDHPPDPYLEEPSDDGRAAELLPAIDPDVIGPDDLRLRLDAEGKPVVGSNPAFAIWGERRLAVDRKLAELRAAREAAGQQGQDPFAALWQVAYTSPMPDLGPLLTALTAGTPAEREQAEAQVQSFNLSGESFTRFATLRARGELARRQPPRADPLTAEDWADVDSILTQAWKVRQFPGWRKQEGEQAIMLGGEPFWSSLAEPVVGHWPPIFPAGRPLIDPEHVKLEELPDPTLGGAARRLWQARQAELQQTRQDLQESYRTGGYDALLAHTFGQVPDLVKLQNDLNSSDPQVVDSAKAVITTELHLTVEGFLRLMAIKIKPAPTAAELSEVYGLLVTAHKAKVRYATWLAEEQQAGITADLYWLARKAKLPRWLASVEGRQRWRQSLQARQQPPLVDSDLVHGGYFAKPKAQNPAYQLRRTRRAWVEARLKSLRDGRMVAGRNLLPWFDGALASTLGIPASTLLALADERPLSHPIAARLEQLTLPPHAFETLLRLRGTLVGGGGLLDSEWEDVDSILVQAEKRRQFALWRSEERRQRIILCADFFKLPEASPSRFSSSEPTWLPEWRASWLDRRDWEERLQSRIDQDRTVPQALGEAVSATEALTLPSLRDALVTATGVDVKWLTEHLLIDLQNGGEQLTTRISQAIEAIQGLLWSLRTAQLRDDYPDLTLAANDFDEEWQWLGSYATWRAAMLVFLYPENVLAPRLHRWKTPEFKTLIERSDRLTPEAADRLADDYALALWDFSAPSRDKTVQAAACHADTLILTSPSGEDLPRPRNRLLHYLFAVSSGEVYWSAYDRQEDSDHKQYPWMKVPGLEDARVLELLGAAHHELSGYMYLFVQTISRNSERIQYVRFAPQQPEKALQDRWERQLRTLPWPAEVGTRWVTVVCAAHQSLASGVRLAFKEKSDPHSVLTRALNLEGTGWESDDREPGITLRTGNGIPTVYAVLELFSFKVVLYAQDQRLKVTRFRHTGGNQGDNRTLEVESERFTWIGAEYIVREGTSKVHIFYRRKGTQEVRQRIYDVQAHAFVGPIYTSRDDAFDQVVPSAGHASGSGKRVVWRHSFMSKNTTYFTYRHGRYRTSSEQLIFPYGPAIAPWTTIKSFTAVIRNRQRYREDVKTIVITNTLSQTQHFTHEAYFLAPLHLALQLQANGQYTAALDWFRLIYDYSEPPWNRKVYYGLVSEEQLTVDHQRQADWLLDPLDPHAIAATRRNTYTRYTLLSLIRCLLDYADAEFARDTAESVPRARTLYMTALELLDGHELKPNLPGAGEIIGALEIDLSVAPEFLADWYDIQADLYRIQDRSALQNIVNQVGEILRRDSEPMEERLIKAQDAVAAALAPAPTPTSPANLATVLSEQHEQQHQAYASLLALPAVVEAATQVGASAGQIVTEVVSGRVGGRTLASFGFCVPPNPVVESLRLRAELNLYKLRTGRNIAGIERQLEPYAAAVDAESGLPIIGTSGQLSLPGTLAFNPTPYRYPMLVERAKQLVQLAASIEAAMLSALEKRDAELYNVLKARQDIRLSHANVELQGLRVVEAENGVDLARAQRARAQFQVDHYRKLVEAGSTEHERRGLEYMNDAVDRYSAVADWATVAAIGGTFSGAASGAQQGAQIGALAGPVGSIIGGIAGGLFGGASGAASGFGAKHSARAAQASTRAQIAATEASYERREQEWLLQQSLAQHDFAIGWQQITLAQDRTRIVGQERLIAEMQAQHAEDVLNFLNTKFTNAELYDWMSEVLEGVYRFFLQQATAMAQLAANQLAFERQNTPPSFVQADYWEGPTDGQPNTASANGQTPDRRGLTGSARLLQDIYQLDQYAFETDKRKLQLIKTISLSRLDPYAFQRFRDTGVLPFAMPMDVFDRDFPGHYLRLIKRARTSVVALIPPIDGIHATLSTTGLSRVVIGGTTFQSTIVKRDPETVALSSPLNASGLFELDPQADMLYPFEGMGVDTLWEFRLPKAANRFDYRTIADVLITIEYTALNSFTYQQQVLQSLTSTASGDRPFSFRQQFADQWYDLHNPDQVATPFTVRFTTAREDFPPNLDALRIEHVVLYFARTSDAGPEIPVSGLYFTEQGSAGQVGGAATSTDGVISTRKGNAASWTAMLGKSPFGEWELSLPDNGQIRELFAQEHLEDILFVITFSGRTPEWPL